MSKRKAQSLDVLGETHLPSDIFGDTDGFNGMLDTFPDLGKGMGVLDHETLGAPKEPTSLPDGIVIGDFDVSELSADQVVFGDMGDISEMTREASLVDLSWLELAEQDPERLPGDPDDTSIAELENAWGVSRRTDGLSLTPNVDRDVAVYEMSLTEGASEVKSAPISIEEAVRSASRQVTAGSSFRDVAEQTARKLGSAATQAYQGMARVKDDAGLIGRVFIRAANYPGCASGKWSDTVRKTAAGSKYLVQKKACGQCVHAQNGSCAIFKKQIVSEVPWDAALEKYAPSLIASGRKVASHLPPKEALRKAFADAPQGMREVGDVRPVQPVQVASETEAQQVLAAIPVQKEMARQAAEKRAQRQRLREIAKRAETVRSAVDRGLRGRALVATFMRTFAEADRGIAAEMLEPYFNEKQALAERPVDSAAYSGVTNQASTTYVGNVSASDAWAQLRKVHPPAPVDVAEHKVQATLSRWVQEGLLPKHEAVRLAQSSAAPSDILRVAAALVGRVKVSAYSGIVNDTTVPDVSAEEAWQMLASAEAKQRQATEALVQEAARREHMTTRAGRAEAALRGKVAKITAEIQRGLRGEPLLNLIRKMIAKDEISAASTLLDPILKETGALSKEAAAPNVYQDTPFTRAVGEHKNASGPGFREVDRLLRWAKQQMSEGVVGRDLDHMLQGRFAHSVRTAAMDALRRLRGQQEGLAGHLFVDATAYATENGTKGCEKGALKHRANQIPAVLQMDKCGSCALRVAKEDGTPRCQMYNKRLVASVSELVDDPSAYQKETIRLANGTDADRVASLFANTYENDFNLGGESELDNLVLEDTPENEEVGEVFFGGLEF